MADAMGTIPDEQELLRRYVEAGDVQAFRQLVDAHRDMVFSVCRRILHNVADAEDAAQDCFLQLARKANTLRAPIAGWVHQVALYVALDLRNRKAQREGRETMSAKMRSEAADPHWEELRGFVDDAVSSLPERLRLPVVLHYLEGRTQQEVAAQLRISQPAVSQRLAKGLELLRKRLKRQGFVASCAALAALFSAHAVEAAPAGLSDSAVKIGFSALATGAKAAGGKVLTIGGINVFKAAIVAAVAVVLVLGAAVVFLTAGEAPPSVGTMKVAEDSNAFALDLYAKLKAEPGNLFFSPYSISTALAMTYAGARGDTEKQMAQTLHFGLSQNELHPAFAELSRQEVSSGDYELSVANALWGQQGHAFLPDFIRLTKKHYGAPLQQVDFAASQQAAKTINDWVEEKTNGKITNLISPDRLDALTRLVLTNAIYFKGTWVYQFDKSRTSDRPFLLANRDEVTVPMMSLRPTAFPYARLDDLELLQMPYKGQRLSMLILLPSRNGEIGQVESQLTLAKLNEWIGKLANHKIGVGIPKFKMTSEFSLGETLAALGMKDAFSLPPADFSGVDGRRDLFISAMLHKAFVDVNEEGTEAAAATAVIKTKGESPYFYADHPFIFLIRDETTGSILFMGRVMNPKEHEDSGGVSVNKTPATNPTPPAPAQVPTAVQKVADRGLFPPGNYVITKTADSVIEPRAITPQHDPALDRTRRVMLTETWLMQISQPDEHGNKKMTLTCSRVKWQTGGGDRNVVFDSDMAVDKADMTALAQAVQFRPMLDARLVATMDPAGKLGEIQGAKELLDALRGTRAPQYAATEPNTSEQFGRKFIEQYVGAGVRALPPNPLNKGQEWLTEESTTAPFIGAFSYQQKNRLVDLTDEPQGAIATIATSGEVTLPKEQEYDIGGSKSTVKVMNVKLTGELHINIQAGIVVSSHVRLEENIEGTTIMPPGKTLDIDMAAKCTWTTNIEVRGATPEDLKPRAPVTTSAIAELKSTLEGFSLLGSVRSAENVFKTEKDVFLAVAAGDVLNDPMAARPGLGLDFSRNTYFDAHCVSVALDATYGFVATCDGTAANNAAPRSADVQTCVVQMRGNGQVRSSDDSGTTFTPWE